jgi:hypothetical protein
MRAALMQIVAGLSITLGTSTSATALQPGASVAGAPGAAEGRLELVVVAQPGTSAQRVPLDLGGGREVIAYRFVAAPAGGLDSRAIQPSWEIRVRPRADAFATGFQLTSAASDVTLPRPFGVRLSAGDSMDFVVTVRAGHGESLTLRLIVEFDPVNYPASRLPVIAIDANRRTDGDERSQVWEWIATESGRLVALGGITRGQVVTVALLDADASAVAWSGTVDSRRSGALPGSGVMVRLGVPVIAGRTYRLVVAPADPERPPALVGHLFGLVLAADGK